jgi:hypothetical protein
MNERNQEFVDALTSKLRPLFVEAATREKALVARVAQLEERIAKLDGGTAHVSAVATEPAKQQGEEQHCGNWKPGRQYERDSIVSYMGRSYIAQRDTDLLPVTHAWRLME